MGSSSDKKRKLVSNEAEPVEPEVKKAKKDKKDKKSKRKAVEDVDNVPSAEDIAPAQDDVKVKEKASKKEKKDKKEKRKRDEDAESAPAEKMDVDGESTEKAEGDEEKKKRKKEKKEKKEKKDNKKHSKEKGDISTTQPDTNAETSNGVTEPAAETEGAATQKGNRFIAFVGNLPYSANLESLTKHFEKNPPASIRVATKKEDSRKCRGFAFIEFDNFDRMKTCLKLYHHSMFDDGKYPPRRINVELTAGGGGKSDHRQAKIKAKNEKLNDERQRDAKKIQKDKKKHITPAQQGNGGTGANAVGDDQGEDMYANVHPSRRPRMH
ncbi:hypothetical protein N7474_005389 [Penicillium riverlandense]|uniref:uncharacterized protein n=1 Tax=Penicillium riverlandense TaxID=1903569 RepID=UPI00254808B2|nr:uncharacterized protein N7474_005389 [Penicillium riverlandense]KAJ5819798.1 hypothetical protein N7474_005389 [Penicillium riverlandense]